MGKAPGPEPLKECIDIISEKLDRIVDEHDGVAYLKPIEVHDIICHISDAVLAGGIRRSALISLFSLDDEEMLTSKSNFKFETTMAPKIQGEMVTLEGSYKGVRKELIISKFEYDEYLKTKTLPWYKFEEQRGRANNSVVLEYDKVTRENFDTIWKLVEQSGAGEPGVYWTHDRDLGSNPCCEISLKSKGYCNLTEVIADGIDTQEEYNARARAAAFLGTLQAGYTNFHYLRDDWQDNAEDEALLGVSMTGIASGDVLNLDMIEAGKEAADENERVANLIGINKAKRVTTVKPSGCRPNYALTTTKQGIYTLDELFVDHNENTTWSDMVNNIDIIQDNGFNKAIKTYDNGESEIFVARLAGQLEVESTPEHPWFVKEHYDQKTRKHTSIGEFIPMKDLKPGDVLDIKLGVYRKENHKQLMSLNTFSYRMGNRSKNQIIQPQFMTEDLAWLIGYLWGDGSLSLHKYRLRFVDEFKSHLEKARKVLIDTFGVDAHITKLNDRNAYTLEVSSIELFDWFATNGIRKYNGDMIDYIPKCVRESSYKDIIAFIAGFADADGCIHKYQDDSPFKLLMISQVERTGFTRHLQNVALSVGLHFNHSINSRRNAYSNNNMVLMSLSSESLQDSVKIFENNSIKCKEVLPELHLRSNADDVRNVYTFGMVKSVEFSRTDFTYDIEVDNEHWYYAGAIKSHNTASLVAGTSSGIHAWHAPYYIRRMRINKDEAIYEYLKDKLPKNFLEDDIFSPKTTAVLAVPVKAPEGAIFRDESPTDLMERVKKVHDDWIANEFTHREGVNTHNVSVTVSIGDDQWSEVGDWMWDNRFHYHGISVLPLDTGTYQQMPFTDSTKEEYEELIAQLELCEINLDDIIEEQDNTDLSGELACSGGGCEVTSI